MKNDLKYDLILLDNDGTLVDTEFVINRCFLDVVYEVKPDYKILDVDFILEKCIGQTVFDIYETMAQHAPTALTKEQKAYITQEYQNRAPAYFAQYLKPDPHQIAVLEKLSSHFQLAVVSNGRTRNVQNSLKAIGLKDLFPDSRIYTPEKESLRPKPEPDLIIHALKQCGVTDLSRVLFLDDTVSGCQGGLNAKVPTVGFTKHIYEEAKKVQRIEDLKKIGITTIINDWDAFKAIALEPL